MQAAPLPTPQATAGPLLATGPSLAAPPQLGPGFSIGPGGGLLFEGRPYSPRPAIVPGLLKIPLEQPPVVVLQSPPGPFPGEMLPPPLPPVEVDTPLRPPGRLEGVPEPGSWLLTGLGLVIAGVAVRRGRKGV